MTFDLAQMIADRDAGTPGEWFINGPTWNQIVWTDNETRLCFMTHSNGLNDARDEANARRIASVPLFEAEIIRLTARVAKLEGATVTVKPLVWVKSHMTPWQDDWHTIPTAYTIRCCDENGWKWQGNGGHGYEPSAKHAMTAVQGIHEAAIRAALSTPTEEPKT